MGQQVKAPYSILVLTQGCDWQKNRTRRKSNQSGVCTDLKNDHFDFFTSAEISFSISVLHVLPTLSIHLLRCCVFLVEL